MNAKPPMLTPEQMEYFELYRRDWKSPMQFLYTKMRGMMAAAIARGIEPEEIEQESWLSVARAATWYDPTRKASFPTYANASLIRAVSDLLKKTRLKRVIPPDKIISGNAPVDTSFGGFGEVFGAVFGTLDARPGEADGNTCFMDVLNDQQNDIIARRFGLDGHERQTLDQIAKELGLSKERIRQIERIAIKKMQRAAGVA